MSEFRKPLALREEVQLREKFIAFMERTKDELLANGAKTIGDLPLNIQESLAAELEDVREGVSDEDFRRVSKSIYLA